MKKSNKTLVLNFLFNCLIGMLFADILGFSPIIGAVIVNTAGIGIYYLADKKSILFDGLATQVWIPLVMEDPYPNASFVNAATNMSSLVEHNKINFAQAGLDPEVLVNNVIYPVPIVDAQDAPLDVPLKYYDTVNTVVRNAVAIELAYDQRALYANKHKKALAKKIGMDAAYMYAPNGADASKWNFIIDLAAGDSIIDAIIDMQAAYNNADADSDRNLVLCPNHLAKIAKEDKLLYKLFMAEPGSMYCGFRIWTYTRNPFYNIDDQTKAAYGVAFDPEEHKNSSFSFLSGEVMVADGDLEMFYRLNDPEARGDIFGFQKRSIASSLRGCFGGAILQ